MAKEDYGQRGLWRSASNPYLSMEAHVNRDEFVEKLKSQLDEMNSDVDALEARLQSAEDGVKEKYQQQLAQAKTQRAAAEEKLHELRDAGEDAWEQVKEEAEHAWKAFDNSVKYFKSHFK
jgi:chromosome segregation ATPase